MAPSLAAALPTSARQNEYGSSLVGVPIIPEST